MMEFANNFDIFIHFERVHNRKIGVQASWLLET